MSAKRHGDPPPPRYPPPQRLLRGDPGRIQTEEVEVESYRIGLYVGALLVAIALVAFIVLVLFAPGPKPGPYDLR